MTEPKNKEHVVFNNQKDAERELAKHYVPAHIWNEMICSFELENKWVWCKK